MSNAKLIRGTTEYLNIKVTADVTLDSQLVAISFDRTNWINADWAGVVGDARICRILANDVNLPARIAETPVYVKVTDSPEIPVLHAGTLEIV